MRVIGSAAADTIRVGDTIVNPDVRSRSARRLTVDHVDRRVAGFVSFTDVYSGDRLTVRVTAELTLVEGADGS